MKILFVPYTKRGEAGIERGSLMVNNNPWEAMFLHGITNHTKFKFTNFKRKK